MQTFMPHQTYAASARALDKQRLGKQRVEAAQILGILLGVKWDQDLDAFRPDADSRSFSTHPAVLMWKGAERGLMKYIDAVCSEWKRRGFQDSVQERVLRLIDRVSADSHGVPDWLDGDEVCSSHRAVLLAKDPNYYSQFGWAEQPAKRDPLTGRWPYVWPVISTEA